MNNNLKFRLIVIVAVVLICAYGIIGSPNIPKSKTDIVENWKHNIHLGLDLVGGSELVLEIQLQDAFKAQAEDVINHLKDEMRKQGIEYTDMEHNDPQSIKEADSIQINVTGVPPTKAGDFRKIFNDTYNDTWILTPTSPTDYRINIKPTEALRLKDDALTQSINSIKKKVDAATLGLAEASVQKRSRSGAEAEVLVQLPGQSDSAHIKQLLRTQAVLELHAVQGGPYSSREDAMKDKNGALPYNAAIYQSSSKGGAAPEFYILTKQPVVTGRDLRDATPQQGQNGGWEADFVLSQDASKRFGQYTESNIGQRLAIVLDKIVLSAPVIKSKISDRGMIEGLSGREEATDLALNLRAGSLPAGVEFLDETMVGPSLGNDSIKEGLVSGAAGVVAVVLLMLVYYKRSGINATLALVLNALILIAVLSYAGAVLTLPGIAGVILTIGMAVDSNVLIFERIREELRAGKAAMAAMEAGFGKALLTIIDTHVTTMVSCALLFLFGTGPVQGFAITLVIGLAANVFTAIFVSKTIFYWELTGPKRMVTISI
jgi:preprotein translocase subunit SecD